MASGKGRIGYTFKEFGLLKGGLVNSGVSKFIEKSRQWKEEMLAMRALILPSKLEEELKWGMPCYCLEGTNVLMLQPFKNFLGVMFFKGALMKDPKRILRSAGPHSQVARRFEFSSVAEIKKIKTVIASYVKESIAIEKSGQKVTVKKRPIPMPEELKKVLSQKPKLKKAFESLTPGRQRAYLIHFGGAKQSETRLARIEKSIPRILAGKGMNDR